MIAKSKLNSLNPKTKQLMVKKPVAGQVKQQDYNRPPDCRVSMGFTDLPNSGMRGASN